jgi:hypothetical protein
MTLHDAAFTTPGNVPKLERVFRERLDATGFAMTFKTAGA